MSSERAVFCQYEFALVVCRHPTSGKYLAVNESRGRGWWMPAGGVDAGESFAEAGLREAKEEAGVDVRLLGVLRMEQTVSEPLSKANQCLARARTVFFAEPADLDAPVKSEPDEESDGAAWMSVGEMEALVGVPKPAGLRGHELLIWGRYLDAGGAVMPLGTLCTTPEVNPDPATSVPFICAPAGSSTPYISLVAPAIPAAASGTGTA